MIQFTTQELCTALDGKLIAGVMGEFQGVSINSRTVESGQLFFAIIGEKLDGHRFVQDALNKGAAGAVVSQPLDVELEEGQFLIQVANTTQAMQQLAHYYRKQFDHLKVVGITGSAGKTTTKDMIAAVLAEKYNLLKTEGNLNNYYGLPLTLFQLKPEHEVLVVEMGMSNLKEIELLAKLAEPSVGVVTNVGHSHMEFLKTLDNVAKAKQELIENLVGQRLAVLNTDDYRVRQMAGLTDQVLFYGKDTDADYRILEMKETDLTGTELLLKAENQELFFKIPLPGEHNVYNALAAIAVGRVWGVSFQAIQQGLLKFRPSKMRMDILELEQGVIVLNDAYNANPNSMKASLLVLAQRPGRKVAVLGDMLELGEYAEDAHREIGQYAYKSGIDLIFAKGDYAPQVAEGAISAGATEEKVFTFRNNQELAKRLIQLIQPNDTILIKGSRGMKMEEVLHYLEEKVN